MHQKPYCRDSGRKGSADTCGHHYRLIDRSNTPVYQCSHLPWSTSNLPLPLIRRTYTRVAKLGYIREHSRIYPCGVELCLQRRKSTKVIHNDFATSSFNSNGFTLSIRSTSFLIGGRCYCLVHKTNSQASPWSKTLSCAWEFTGLSCNRRYGIKSSDMEKSGSPQSYWLVLRNAN